MKTFIIALLLVSIINTTYSQEDKSTEDAIASLKMEELPSVVIKSAGKDFSVYLPDNNPDKNVKALQRKFIGYRLGKDFEGYDTYLVMMESKKGTLVANYNENGKLIRVVENYKNVILPNAVIYSLFKEYPGWEITNDKFIFSQEDGDITKKEYTIKMKKGKETRKIVVKPDGEIKK
ncbi:hypothetical protein [Flavobacterium sp. K5-23]|uniref:hypothetical protein n=1 Tax=Flavobacterium sp. K5-23 TaxID=2746225 RepID=UPI00200C686B|nr:hypothetical protein [Flavobacterium sp. K5-23]UQD57564.1 hypothetical protein FLAK523_14685 [Flavobacterium sp. K5-23]